MEKLMKALLVFWGIVLVSMALKFLSSFTPSKIDFSFSDYIDTDAISEMLHLTPADKKEEHSTTPKNEEKIEILHPEEAKEKIESSL